MHNRVIMELYFSFIISLVISFLILTKTTIIFFKEKKNSKKLPPGPWQLPLIGNMHQLMYFGSLAHHTLRDFSKKYGPFMFLKLGFVPTIVVSSAEIAETVLKTHGVVFAERPYVLASKVIFYDSTDIAFTSYGDYWRQLRKICTMELLSTKRVEQLCSIREEEALNLVRRISTNGDSLPLNLSKAIFYFTCTVTSRSAFGNKNKDQEEFEVVLDQVAKALGGFNIADMYPKANLLHKITGARTSMNKTQKRMDRILQNMLVEHRNRKQESLMDDYEDLVDVLLRIQKEDQLQFPLTDNCIKAVILDVFGGGSETSSAITEWAMSEMVKNPHIMKRAQDEVRKVFDEKRNVDETGLGELKYLQCVIKETLRLHPSLPLLVPRENSAECEVNGFLIPANSKVIINAWAISRDPKYWVDAEIFKPERFMDNSIDFKGTNFEFIPFGAGRRICPGMSFGMANIELPLAQLLFHFNWKLPNESKLEEIDMTEEFGISVRRKNHLKLIPVLYHSSDLII